MFRNFKYIPKLQLITNRFKPCFKELKSDHEFCLQIEKSIQGGVDCVQYWHHQSEDGYKVSRKVQEICKYHSTMFIINDYVDLAMRTGADGVWLGQNDMNPMDAREILGQGAFIGLTCDSIENVHQANELPLNTVSCISCVVNPSLLNPAAVPFGTEGLIEAINISRHPIIALGGLNIESASEIINIGAAGIALSGQIMHHEDPYSISAEYCDLWYSA